MLIFEKFYNLYKIYTPKIFNTIIKELRVNIKKLFNKRSFKNVDFPLDKYGKVVFYKYPFLKIDKKEYYAQIHYCNKVTDYIVDKRGYEFFEAEILVGEYTKRKKLYIKDESLLPISIPNRQTDEGLGSIDIIMNGKKINLKKLKFNSFHYLPIKNRTEIEIQNDENIIIANPISTIQKNKNKKKLVMSIFIDGLSSVVFEKFDFKTLMPNTSQFFKKGTIFKNGFSNAEWTNPSLPTLFSGLYVKNHKLYHPNDDEEIGKNYKIISEIFQENGYLTTQICSNHRKSPLYKYVKGFDRTIYKRNFNCDLIVSRAIEHLETFKNRDNYMWLSFFELHHFLNGIPGLLTQFLNEIEFHNYDKGDKKSVFESYDEKRVKWYINELKRLDLYLGILFDYIQKNYQDNEIIVSIVSDHGQAYLGTQKELLSRQKLQVPMMFKGIDYGIQEEFIQNIDYLPTLLKLAGIESDLKIDGQIPEILGGKKREYVFAESIYPNRKYECVIYDKEGMVYAKSTKIIKDIKEIKNIELEFVINHSNKSKIKLYKNIILKHIEDI